jgi:hypothetical protein
MVGQFIRSNQKTIIPLLTLVATLVIVDLIFLGFGALSIWRGNPFLLYYPSLFSEMTAEQISAEARGSSTGWPLQRTVRLQPSPEPKTCGAAIGGSFTFADDVGDSEAWPAVLSQAIGCSVDNLGIDGFGLDQAVVYYQEGRRSDRFVIIGISPAMFLMDGAASWTFYTLGPEHLPTVRTTKPFYLLNPAGELTYVQRPSPERAAIEAHHAHDLFRTMWTPLKPPFSLHVAYAIYNKWFVPRAADTNLADSVGPAVELRRLAWQILRQSFDNKRTEPRVVILMIPTPEYSLNPVPDYASYLNEIRSTLPTACLIDAHPHLHEVLKDHPLNTARTSSGHYSAAGNAALASAVAAGLKSCGILQ